MFAKRSADERASAEHFRAHPEVYGAATPEMITRFENLADGDAGAAEEVSAVADRLEAEGLPPEVAGYVSTLAG